MSTKEEGGPQPQNLSTTFDVNLFLRKTLSDFSQDTSAKTEFHPSHRPSTANKSRQDRRRINRRLADTPKTMTASFSGEYHPESTDPSEGDRLIFIFGEESVTNGHSASALDSAVPASGSQGKLRTNKKMTPCPSRTSLASASSLRPLCRICHLGGDTQGSGEEKLISPCRCAGTMQFVHTSCLVHWLEISTKKMCPTPHCELCGYEYKTHNCLRFQRLRLPRCSHQDKILHLVFVLVLIAMIGCAGLSVLYLKSDGGHRLRTSLNHEDIIVIICSVLFFCSFFVAVFTQYRAEASLCRLLFRCWLINEHWRIKNYDRREDLEWKLANQTLI